MVTEPDGALIEPESGTTSMTSFLCTKIAQDLFAQGGTMLDALELAEPTFRPCGPTASPTAISNADALAEARAFVNYARKYGRRGTPHRA